jgi:hypothetical protein
MSRFDAYRDAFSSARHAQKVEYWKVALHTAGDKLVFNGCTHEQFVDLFHAIASDADNRVVILTGSGRSLIGSMSPESSTSLPHKATTSLRARLY